MSKIHKGTRTANFSIIDNEGANDNSLSWKAKGLLWYLLSRPDNWQVYLKQLSNASKDGRDATAGALKELQQKGYVIKRAAFTEDNKLNGWEFHVFATKHEALQFSVNPVTRKTRNTGNPTHGKPDTTNNILEVSNDLSNDILNNKISFKEFFDKFNDIVGISAYWKGKKQKEKVKRQWDKLSHEKQQSAIDGIESYLKAYNIRKESHRELRKVNIQTYIDGERWKDKAIKQQPQQPQQQFKNFSKNKQAIMPNWRIDTGEQIGDLTKGTGKLF